MSKKSALAATLLTAVSLFSGCNQKSEKTAVEPKEAQVEHVEAPEKSQEQRIQKFEKAAKEIPIFRDELPHAMILSDGKGGYVQMLYPVKRNGVVLESKDQYEKRVKWLNTKYPVNVPEAELSLRGCEWEDYTTPPTVPFVSMFDNEEYIQHHIGWMKKFMEKYPSAPKYNPQNDPVAVWWVEQELPRRLAAEHKASRKVPASNRTVER